MKNIFEELEKVIPIARIECGELRWSVSDDDDRYQFGNAILYTKEQIEAVLSAIMYKTIETTTYTYDSEGRIITQIRTLSCT